MSTFAERLKKYNSELKLDKPQTDTQQEDEKSQTASEQLTFSERIKKYNSDLALGKVTSTAQAAPQVSALPAKADNDYGYDGEQVKSLQRAARIPVTGIWNDTTQKAYNAGYRPADKVNSVGSTVSVQKEASSAPEAVTNSPTNEEQAATTQTALRDIETVRQELVAANAEIEEYTASFKNPGVLRALANQVDGDQAWSGDAETLSDAKKLAELQKKRDALLAEYNGLTGADKRTWFQKGAFEDGFQTGDVTKAAVGTRTDVAENLGTGAISLPEKIADFFAMVAAANTETAMMNTANDAVVFSAINGNETEGIIDDYRDMANDVKESAATFVAGDLYDEEAVAKAVISKPVKAVTGVDAEKDSLLGEKSDALVQSAGQLGATAALQAVGVPWWMTSFATSFGGESENALRQGASFEEAGFSAAITAGAEVLTEKLSGGIKFGKMGTLDDAAAKWLSKSIADKALRYAAKLGLDMAGEGTEEVLSGAISKFGQWLTYQDDKTLEELYLSEEALDEALESYLGGAILGGVGNATQAIQDNRQTQDGSQEDVDVQGENGQSTPETAAGAKPGTLEWVQELNELGKSSANQTKKDAVGATSIKEQIQSEQATLNNMQVVADIQTPKSFSQLDIAGKINWVIEKLRPTGYKVDRKGFGTIKFGKKQLKGAFNYFSKGSVEEAAFEALPYVLKNGIEIASHEDHKNRAYGTVTIAAPVIINGQRGNMAVVVKQTTDNFYKVHRILTPDGAVFDLSETINKAEPTPAGESPETGSLATPISSASNNSISQTEPGVNTNSLQSPAARGALGYVEELHALRQGKNVGQPIVDTNSQAGYDSVINETEGGAISDEGRKETREAFYRRANEKNYTVRERGKISCRYYPAADKTGRAGRTEKALQELGIPVIVHEGLEANIDGVTRTIHGAASSVAGDVVYVRNTLETDPIETAGHEAYHFWKSADARVAYAETVADNIDFSSGEFIQFQERIAKKYFGEDVGIEDDGSDKFGEEIFAYITGLVHAGDSENIIHPFLRDYDVVKAAWDALIKKQTQGQSVDQTEVNTNLTESVGAAPANPSVGAANQNFTGRAAYQDLLTDENSQRDRPGDVRPIEVPKVDGYGRKVSEFVGNAYGAEVTSDQMAQKIEELVQDGALGFDIRSNKQSMQEAAATIKEKGEAAVRNSITKNIANGRLQDGDIEKAMLLYTAYANRKSQSAQDNAAELMVDLATMANMAGRNLQLFKVLRQMTPQGQRMSVQKTVDRYVDQLNSKRGKRDQVSVSIPQELLNAYEEAARKDQLEHTELTEKDKAEIEQQIYKIAASQIKATPMEKLNAWRYMAMLGNAKTQARNFVGNLVFRPYVNVKRTVGAALETMLIEKENRTKAVLGFGKQANALKQWAAEDAKNATTESLFKYSSKSGDEKSQIGENRAIYNTKWLEAVRKFVQNVPEGADMIFKRWEYTVSLASFMKARGYTAEQLTNGEVSESILSEGREYAAHEALKATFNDQNAVSDLLSKRYKGSNLFGKTLNLLAEGVMPFRRTPANIAVRAAEYSPVNLVRAGINAATKLRSGEMSGAEVVDQLAAGLTGSASIAMGAALASGLLFGIKLVGHLDDDDEENAGHQSYAIECDGKSYSIDWAAPANIPLFIGANIYQNLHENADTGFLMNLLDSTANTLEPMLELSCLSSINDLLENLSYAEDGTKLYTAAASMATSYLSQYIPTLFGQLERATESSKKQVYSDADTALERSMEKTIGYQTQKLFIDLFQTQKYDNWGNAAQTSKWFDALINPSTVSTLSTDPVDQEIMRLNDAQTQINVSVDKPSQSISYTDTKGEKHTNQRLTNTQWETIQQVYGQTAHTLLSELISSEGYGAMSDTQKAEAFQLAYDYAREASRIAAIEDYPGYSDSWMEGIEETQTDAIIQKVTTDTFSDALSSMTKAWNAGNDDSASVTALSAAYSLYDDLTGAQRKAVTESAQGRVSYALAAMEAGVSAEDFAELYNTYYGISNSDTLSSTQKATNWSYALEKAVEDGTLTQKQKAVLKENMMISTGFKVQTEKYDAMTTAGLSADTANDVIDLIGELAPQSGYTNVRDIQKAEAIVGADLSEKEKKEVLKIYLSDSQDENLDEMLDMGYSTADYAAVYRIYTDERDEGGAGTKKRTIAAIREELGCSQSVAEAVYDIYG